MNKIRFAIVACAIAFVAQSAFAATVIEFYNVDLDNYFITADPTEQAFVDTGAVGRWQRTGTSFPAGGSVQVCRFYGSPFGPNSHFYTANAQECNSLSAAYNPSVKSWKFESYDFSIGVPVNGACATGQVPIYRAYNNGFARNVDSNHRITPSLTDIQQVVARGWVSEGVVMCAALTITEPVNKTNTARLVGGSWTFAYTIISTFSQKYSFTSVDSTPSSTGVYYAHGKNQFGGAIIGAYYPATSTASAAWAVLEPATLIDRFYEFTFGDDNHVSGCYFQISPSGSTNLSRCYPMAGSRSQTPLSAKASNSIDREDQEQEEVLLDPRPSEGSRARVELYLQLRSKTDQN